jgi:plasmid stabilization system protein ParE
MYHAVVEWNVQSVGSSERQLGVDDIRHEFRRFLGRYNFDVCSSGMVHKQNCGNDQRLIFARIGPKEDRQPTDTLDESVRASVLQTGNVPRDGRRCPQIRDYEISYFSSDTDAKGALREIVERWL